MTLVDTHCHLHFDAFDADRQAVIDRALEAGVKYLVNVGTDPASNRAAADLADGYNFMKSTAGLHPHHAHEVSEKDLQEIEVFVRERKPAAIGEIGLDYFKSEADPALQKKVFSRMLGLAAASNLPVIVHSRNAFDDTFEILRSEFRGRGVMHCFSYDPAALSKLLDIGFLASFTCNVTFKNSAVLLETAKAVPLDRLMLETDSPYLAPQILRGRRNEPANLAHLAGFLAAERKIALEELAARTSANADRFFGLGAADA